MPEVLKHHFVVYDGTFAIRLLEEYQLPYKVIQGGRKKGIDIFVASINVVQVRELFTISDLQYKELKS